MLQPKITMKDCEIDANLALDVCCEPDCHIPVMVDKDMKEQGRQVRCISCLMKFKLGTAKR